MIFYAACPIFINSLSELKPPLIPRDNEMPREADSHSVEKI
jgi:hypothetical protein